MDFTKANVKSQLDIRLGIIIAERAKLLTRAEALADEIRHLEQIKKTVDLMKEDSHQDD